MVERAVPESIEKTKLKLLDLFKDVVRPLVVSIMEGLPLEISSKIEKVKELRHWLLKRDHVDLYGFKEFIARNLWSESNPQGVLEGEFDDYRYLFVDDVPDYHKLTQRRF